ncbi:MAG: hypothetical protein RLZ22_129 [Verrucomicrobiota bacterium]|jgi:hypothetical protein
MRLLIPIYSCLFAAYAVAQDASNNPSVTPTEELRNSVREWVETKRKIQQEENDWKRDLEVLQNYKEGLEKEIADLTEQIKDAKNRKSGADQESLNQSAQRDRYMAAKSEMANIVRGFEESLMTKIPSFPPPLAKEAKVAQGIEDLKRDMSLPTEKRGENLSKRLLNVVNLLTEAEKFQQTVHVRSELHKDKHGKEFNMQVVYFGLAVAYAVNEDGSLALVGRPTSKGWKFEEREDLADDISKLLAATTGESEATFTNLPFSKP